MDKPQSKSTVLFIGFMMFSTFFGAGNLIFPPYLGMVSGEAWAIGFLGFLIGDVVLAMLSVIAACKFPDANRGILTRGGSTFAAIMNCICVLCVGPLLAIPRTGSVTYEISIVPLFPGFNSIVFSIIFFVITFFLAIRPTKVVDYVGKILTPCLLVALAIMIIKGIITPLGEIRVESLVEGDFAYGLLQGYQTLDVVGGVIVATLVATAIAAKGFTDQKSKIRMATQASLVGGIALFLVYGGLSFLGATVSKQYNMDVNQTQLLVAIVNELFGQTGKVILGIVVFLACLTTSTGMSSSIGNIFSQLTNNKLKYEYVVLATCVISGILCNFGVSTIIQFSIPILLILCPTIVTMIVLSLFTDFIKNDNVFKFAAYMGLFIGALTTFNVPFINVLPFASIGFAWVVPVAIAGIIGNFVPMKQKA